ncbi:MAG: hypothetical protein PHF46_03665, partial [Candidatus Gracilibacteria bacterium]|nr:hypothetical protein [Candidatus Gracilibacteria bacterium]
EIVNEEQLPEGVDNFEIKNNKRDSYRDKGEGKKARFIGVISNLRKIQTKKGTLMLIAQCESFTFKFTITVFPKSYEKYVGTLLENTILMVDGKAYFNENNGEISIMPDDIKTSSVEKIRNQAKSYNLFNEDEKVNFINFEIREEEAENQEQTETIEPKTLLEDLSFGSTEDLEIFEKEVEQEEDVTLYGENINDPSSPLSVIPLSGIHETNCPSSSTGLWIHEATAAQDYHVAIAPRNDETLSEGQKPEGNPTEHIIIMPKSVKKEDLIELKNFLSSQKSGNINIKINVNGNVIDTKISIKNLEELEKWVDKKWS